MISATNKDTATSGFTDYLVADMSLRASIRQLAATYLAGRGRLDVLIHNAAAFDYAQKRRSKTEEGIETIWATNHLGPVLLTNLLLGAIKPAIEREVHKEFDKRFGKHKA